jgi:hypothetical protein
LLIISRQPANLRLLAVSCTPLTVLNYEGAADTEKCSCASEIFSFVSRQLIGESDAAVIAYFAIAWFSC